MKKIYTLCVCMIFKTTYIVCNKINDKIRFKLTKSKSLGKLKGNFSIIKNKKIFKLYIFPFNKCI